MGKIRKFSPHVKWNDQEVQVLMSHYSDASHEILLRLLPGRTKSQVQNKANAIGLRRNVPPKISDEERLKRKREYMAKKRADNPDMARKYHRERHHKNHEFNKEKMRDYYAKRFFWGRAMKLRGDGRATFKELASMWKRQKGMCGLTGRRLDRSAQLDHIVPKARGGSDKIENLRWVCEEANLAKRNLTDDEFFALCREVMNFKADREG